MNKRLTALILTALASLPALADSANSRLERIRETGIMVAGYREMAVPFSYLDNGRPTGFGVALTERVAAAVRHELQAPDVRIRWNAVTLSTRIPMMATNTVDIICATDTHTRARAELVGFSTSFYITNTAMAVNSAAGLTDIGQLAGKRVAVAAGSPVESLLKKGIDGHSFVVQPALSNHQAMQMLNSGRADAYVNAETIVAGELIRLPSSAAYSVVRLNVHEEALACMLPKGDAAFKKLVDGVLGGMMRSGEMTALYEQWFGRPIPPFGKSLNVPLNERTRALYQAPDDQPLE